MIINLVKKTSSGSAAAKDPNVIIIATKSITGWPARDSKKVAMVGSFVLGPNPKIAEVYMTASKTKAPYESDGDEDSMSIKQMFEGEHPGNKKEINEFVADWLNEPCIVIHGSCQDDFRKVVGTKCAPLQLKPSGQDDNDARKHMLKFDQFAKSEYLPGHYTGNTPTIVPATVADVSSMTVNSQTDGLVYQLPSHAVTEAIAIIWSSLVPGEVITLIGGGGVAPATLSDIVGTGSVSNIVLKNGTPWVALDGATISLRSYSGARSAFFEETRTA